MADYSFFQGDLTYPTVGFGDDNPYTFGLEFEVLAPCKIKSVHFVQPETNGNNGIRKGIVYKLSDQSIVVGSKDFAAPVSGWNHCLFDTQPSLQVGQRYKACVVYPAGRYVVSTNYFSTGAGGTNRTVGPIRIFSSSNATHGQNSFNSGATPTFPATSTTSHFWIDVTVSDPDTWNTVKTVADYARELMLAELGATEPDFRTNVDLMQAILITPGQTFFDAGGQGAGNAYASYLIQLRNSVGA